MSPDLHPHILHKISGIVQKGNPGISAFTSQSHIFPGIELVQIWVPEWLVSLVVNQRHQGHCVNPHLTSVVVLSPHNHLILLCISLSFWSIVFTLLFTYHCKIYTVLLCTRLCGLGYLCHAFSNGPENHLILNSACLHECGHRQRKTISECLLLYKTSS